MAIKKHSHYGRDTFKKEKNKEKKRKERKSERNRDIKKETE